MITRRDHLTTAKVDEMSVTVNESPIRYYTPGGGGGTPRMKGVGILVGNFELNS